ncbi:helix-turn-helix domain-containing protein [Acrocarpospora catenulata]|uniref:helix-turn-helix domain-containing protein n=1 Tax=Acrocarpospora catenulata TaxID=2836182 RepID=UPI001BDB5DF4|nr:helix-turn-helix domain-containing protein [Acrocarpospora catenulata]
MSIGTILTEARQQAELTVAQLSDRTRIREPVIAAMERDDFSTCGAYFYTRGHLRVLAKALGLDADEMVRLYDEECGGAPAPLPASALFVADTPIKIREAKAPNWTMAMGVALAIVMVFGVIRMMGSPNQEPVRTAARAAPPAAAPGARPKVPAAVPPLTRPVQTVEHPVVVRISAVRPAWVNVRDAKGRQLFEGLIAQGKTETFTAKKKIQLQLANAGSVRLMVNGKDLGMPGKDGQRFQEVYGPGVPSPR